MLDRIQKRMRDKVRFRDYVMTLHGEEEMDEDDLTIFDVESVILTGEIFERQKDTNTAEWKYLLKGQTVTNENAIVVAKFSPLGKLVIMTVFRP